MTTHELERAAPRRPELVAVDGRTYPLESLRLDGRAQGGIARTLVIQRFANPYDEALEVVYTMPLPADGAVLGYTVRIGERIICGEVQPREKAAESYRQAVYQGRTAALLEQDRDDTFTQRLGNLPAHTAVDVEIQVLQPLAFLTAVGGEPPMWEYRFPTVVGVRYEGAPGRVPDAERLDADRAGDGGIPTRVDVNITIADELEQDRDDGPVVTSPHHPIVVERSSDGRLVRLAQAQRLDRDVVLRWPANREDVSARVIEGGGLEGDEGRYALVTIVPPAVATAALHRDLTVLIDASGSMDGQPLDLAKRVVADLLASLEVGDRFELLAFATKVDRLTSGLVSANARAVRDALNKLERLAAGGATEMLDAIDHALAPLRRDAQRQIVLVTDGYIGFEHEIVGRIAREAKATVRVHAVGIGAAPNRTLLRGVALAGRGVELSASNDATAHEAAYRLRSATVRPVLTDATVGGKAVRQIATGVRDVCAGQPLVVAVELAPEGGMLEVTGQLAGVSEPWSRRFEVPAARSSAEANPDDATPLSWTPLPLGALYGRSAIDIIELMIATSPPGQQLDSRIEQVAMRHRIVSRMTSLVAIADEPSVDPRAPRRRERLAVEVPAGVSAEGTGLLMRAQPGGLAMRYIDAAGSEPVFGGSEDFERQPASMLHKSILLYKPETMGYAAAGFITGTVVRVDEDTLIVEFESPWDGFLMPTGDVDVAIAHRETRAATVVTEQSTPVQELARGLVVRLALRLHAGERWDAEAFVLVWDGRHSGQQRAGKHGSTPRKVRVLVILGSGVAQPGST